MFVCNECHIKQGHLPLDNTFHLRSRGPCEDCGVTYLCGDCHCGTKAQAADG